MREIQRSGVSPTYAPYRLRVSELVALRSEQIDLKLGLLHVNRLKNGMASTHPLISDEIERRARRF